MIVRDVMETDVETIYLDGSVLEATRQMLEAGVGSLVVTKEDGDVVGIVTGKDLAVGCIGAGHRPWECLVFRHMSFPVITVTPDADVREALRLMTANDIRHLPVMEGQKLVGLTCLSDIVRALHLRPEESLVGTNGSYEAV